jgi:acyl-CoA synthetase (NDP forming)
VAIVGAAERLTSSGGAILRNLQEAGFRGGIIPVNPRGGEILGLPVRTSLAGLHRPADLVVVVVRPDLILDVVSEGAESGHRNFLILPGGFAEAGEEGRRRDEALRALVERHGLIIAGPNCAGLINLMDPTRPFAATFLRDLPRGGSIAFVSQSGAIAEELIEKSHTLEIPLGAVASVGNAMQLNLEDYLEHFAGDPYCSCVLLYLESPGDAARFIAVAREAAARKPLVALFGGRTLHGSEAARAHTGAQPLSALEIDRFCAQASLLCVTSLRELMLAGKGFARYPEGIGRRILLLSNSGGPGVIATDRASAVGLELPPLPASLAARLHSFLPPEASIANPLDLLADAREDRFGETLKAALEAAPGWYDAILMIHVVPFMVDAAPVIARLAELAPGAGIPLFHSMMGTLADRRNWFATMEASGVPMFNDVEEMAATAGMLARYRTRT